MVMVGVFIDQCGFMFCASVWEKVKGGFGSVELITLCLGSVRLVHYV